MLWPQKKLNGKSLTKKAWKQIELLRNAANFTKETSDLKTIYITFIRPVLEQSAPVWHSSLTAENASDLERIQKAAVHLIMGIRYEDYHSSLKKLKLETLVERRRKKLS